ncbi:cache domain-containing protein [Gaoshiqia sp. Z1-71]|uniref:cache domain-containing protein n=1 Tax=Gaoshiqia hydrogeniformans TaxID=3290090 RepID=UPI003BF8CD22
MAALRNAFTRGSDTRNVTNYIRRIVVFSTIIITVGVAALISIQEFLLFQRISTQQREDNIGKQKDFIKDLIAIEVDYIANQKTLFNERIARELEENVCNAHRIAQKLYHQFNGRLPVAELKQIIVEAISSLDCSGTYARVFINGMDGQGIYYSGRPELAGKDLSGLRDINGHLVIQRELELLKNEGEGYIWYDDGNRPENSSLPHNKVTFVKEFKPFNWYFGSKCYLDDYYADFKQEIAKKVSSERFRHGGYVFINETNGTPVVMDGKVHDGPFNFFDETDPERLAVFMKELEVSASAENGGYFSYEWNKIDEETKSSKISYVALYPECNWLVGAGFYVDEVDAELVTQKAELKRGLWISLVQIFVVLFIILAIEIYILIRFNRNYEADFLRFARFFKLGKGNYAKIDVDKLNFNEFREMGIVANEMIEEREKVLAQLVKEQKKARESDRLKTAFLANMSHEIRTPMNAILGFSELIDDDDLPDRERKTFVKMISVNGKFLMNLINDIIDIAKIESDQLNIVKKEFRLENLLESILLYYREYISGNQELDQLCFEVESSLPAGFTCYTDEFRLRQVLDNLIGNAIKFTPAGMVKLIVYARDEKVWFHVHDNGIGIPEKDLGSVFDRFVQASNHVLKNYGGTGLGLAISKNIVSRLGGEIGVKSTAGEGSEFYFHIDAKP